MAVKDGLPSTDFSRMNREWVKNVAEESGGAGLPPVTEADNGKILGVVNGAWGAMDAGGGGDESPAQMATVTLNIGTGLNIKAVEFNANIPYPVNPNSSSVYNYGANFVIGNTNDVQTAPDLDSTITVDILMYNGIGYIPGVIGAHLANGNSIYPESVSLSGNAETEADPGGFGDVIKVTGDCTITITWKT